MTWKVILLLPQQVTSHLDGVSRRAVTDIGSGVILQANGGEKRLSLPWACYSLLLDDVEPEREIMCQNLTKLHNNWYKYQESNSASTNTIFLTRIQWNCYDWCLWLGISSIVDVVRNIQLIFVLSSPGSDCNKTNNANPPPSTHLSSPNTVSSTRRHSHGLCLSRSKCLP